MATPFSSLYEAVRVVTGNDDPDIGSEVMPDSRIDVLLRTAAKVLRVYSKDFTPVDVQLNGSAYELFPEGSPTSSLDAGTSLGLVYVAAHRYFVGIGNRQASAEIFADITNITQNFGAVALRADNEQTLPNTLQAYQGVLKLF